MPFSYKTKWMAEHPAWPWIIFFLNTFLIAAGVVSILLLIAQQNRIVREVNEIDQKLVRAVRANQSNVDIIAKKVGVPKHKLDHPKMPDIPSED